MSELPSAPVSIGGVLDAGFRLYRSTFSRAWLLALVASAPGVAAGVMALLSVPDTVAQPGLSPLQILIQTYSAFFSPPTLGVLALAVLVGPIFYGALIATESAVGLGNPAFSLGKALGRGLRGLPAVLIAGILSTLLIGVGLVLVFIPGIYFIGKLQLWLTAVFVEDVGPLKAIGTSWRLTRQRWWRGIAILSIALIIVGVFGVAFGLLAGVVATVEHLTFTQRTLLTQAGSFLSDILFLPLYFAIAVAMYHDFKLRSQGGDLAARVDALGKA